MSKTVTSLFHSSTTHLLLICSSTHLCTTTAYPQLLKTTTAQNHNCSKPQLLKTTTAQNHNCSKPQLLIHICSTTTAHSQLTKQQYQVIMFADCHLAKVQERGIKLKVNNGIVSGSCSMIDGGTTFTCYFYHAQLIYYFAKAGTGSYHCVYGPQTVNAYKARDSNKPSVSVNIQPWKVGPSRIEHGKISTSHEVNIVDLEENLKIKLVVYMFMIQHWGEENVDGIQLNYQLGNQESLVNTINLIVQQLKTKKMLNVDAPNAIKKQDVVLTAGETRPGLMRQLQEYIVNDAYPTNITKTRDETWFDTAFNIPAE